MTDLSPAAQAVITASNCAGSRVVQLHIAAALRAAADRVLAAQWQGRIEPDAAHSLGINWTRDALHAIAAELEGQ
jgi:hypothetical protein